MSAYDLDLAETIESASARLADWAEQRLRAAVAARGRAFLAVPGGTTPGPFLDILARRSLPWSRILLAPTDERCVPVDHPRSNEGMIRRRFTPPLGPDGCSFLSLALELASPEAQALEASGRLAAAGPLDVCILGMGEDMHVASLFPGDSHWTSGLDAATGAWAGPLAIPARPAGQEPRVSLSPAVLRGAAACALLIAGQAKRDALAAAVEAGDPARAPVALLFGSSPRLHVFSSR